jgi:hypothetical protein
LFFVEEKKRPAEALFSFYKKNRFEKRLKRIARLAPDNFTGFKMQK